MSESYVYDNNANLVSKIDRKGVKTLYSYNNADRVSTVTYCGNPVTSTSFAYDKNGNTLTAQNENATITYGYDARNRLLTEKYAVNSGSRTVVDLGCNYSPGSSNVSGGTSLTYTVTFAYSGEVLDTIIYPTISITNIGVKYAYDGMGRTLNITKVGTSTYYARFAYFKNNQLSGVQYGNGLIGNYTYDVMGRPSKQTLKDGGTILLSLNYLYYKTGTASQVSGNITSATVNESYNYDALQRLTNSTVTSQGTTTTLWYEYDKVGNRQRQSLNGAITTYNNNLYNNTLTSSSATGTSIAYSYDRNGNLLTENITSGGTTRWAYAWNVPALLLRVTQDGTTKGTYAYDAAGRLVESLQGSTTAFLAYSGARTLFNSTYNQYSIDFLDAAGMMIARVDSSSGSYSTTQYFHVDPLGSVRLVTSSTKTIVFGDSYQPFGKDNGNPTGSNVQKFTGKPWSSSINLYYSYQRWYDPTTGRFISQDPLRGSVSNPQSLNAYLYAADSPTVNTDPTGLLMVANTTPPQCRYHPNDYLDALWHSIAGPFLNPQCTLTGGVMGIQTAGSPAGAVIVAVPLGIIAAEDLYGMRLQQQRLRRT